MNVGLSTYAGEDFRPETVPRLDGKKIDTRAIFSGRKWFFFREMNF
jgi:hypothetical protein